MLYTAAIWRPADHRGLAVDCTVKSAAPADACLAPTWELVMGSKRGSLTWPQYTEGYVALLRARYRDDPRARARMAELAVLATTQDVTLLCFCRDPRHCHRSILAGLLQTLARKLGHQLQTEVR